MLNVTVAESNPVWWSTLDFSMPPVVPGCQLGGAQVALGLELDPRYAAVGQTALGLYTTAQSGENAYLNATPQNSICGRTLTNALNVSLAQVASAVSRQVPWDSFLTTKSLYDDGIWFAGAETHPQLVSMLKLAPVCAVNWKGMTWRNTVAVAQTHSFAGPSTGVYIAPVADSLPYLKEATVLHESLHNLTGLTDDALYSKLHNAMHKQPPTDGLHGRPSTEINILLNQSLCTEGIWK
jgi:hypothetical protein